MDIYQINLLIKGIIDMKINFLSVLKYYLLRNERNVFNKPSLLVIGKGLPRADKIFLLLFGWQRFSKPQKFILCGIKLIRK
mgnify:CR=1 FL=1